MSAHLDGGADRNRQAWLGVHGAGLEGLDAQVVGLQRVIFGLVELLGRQGAPPQPRQRFEGFRRGAVGRAVGRKHLLAGGKVALRDRRAHVGNHARGLGGGRGGARRRGRGRRGWRLRLRRRNRRGGEYEGEDPTRKSRHGHVSSKRRAHRAAAGGAAARPALILPREWRPRVARPGPVDRRVAAAVGVRRSWRPRRSEYRSEARTSDAGAAMAARRWCRARRLSWPAAAGCRRHEVCERIRP